MMTFGVAFERVIGHEGGLSLHRRDPGNWTGGSVGVGVLRGTRFGISAARYPREDIQNLTLDRAKQLYRRDFWDRAQADQFPPAVAYQTFDAAVNHGPGTAIRFLQRALDVADDGHVGAVTLGALERSDIDDVLKRFNAERIRFYVKLSSFADFGRGWMERVATNLEYAADDYNAPWYVQVEAA
ncbi:glycosyl hydrolase 108 family protein [Cobetia sp. MMG027]|uniref:glycoside hydrolase family 108 protein n=1 Tax=Cobetia sp. MMG027 TaxID=3021980 RepID=UPI0022FE4A86|nr:glycosyl hydrolase 108 family protein [Cobetia sp. MMG027]MDA5564379.1 glycosyl hydrolase 108 family protein [Cobetia sp. MMG027]